jgi:hypothetical protein
MALYCIAEEGGEEASTIEEDEDTKEGVALMEAAIESLEQAQEILTTVEEKVCCRLPFRKTV